MVYDKPVFNDDGSIHVCPKGMETSISTASRLMNVNVGFDSNGNMLRCLKLLREAIEHLMTEKNVYIYVPHFKSDASKIDNMTYEELVSFFDLENGMRGRKGLSRDTLDSLEGYLDSFKAKEHLTREDLLKYIKLIHEGCSNNFGLFPILFRKPYTSEPLCQSGTTDNTEDYTSYKVRTSTHLWDVETEKCRLTPIYVKKYSLGWWNVADGTIFRRLSDSIKVFNQSDINQFRLRMEDGIEKVLGKAGDSSLVELLDDVYGLNLGNYKRYMDFIGFALFQLKHQVSSIGSYKLQENGNLRIFGAHVPMVSYFDFS